MNRAAPWEKIKGVNQFDGLNQDRVRAILNEYGKDDGIDKGNLDRYFNLFKNKRYCLLIFLENPEVIEPFQIDKTGFGAMAAWICVEDMEKIKIPDF